MLGEEADGDFFLPSATATTTLSRDLFAVLDAARALSLRSPDDKWATSQEVTPSFDRAACLSSRAAFAAAELGAALASPGWSA